MIIDHTSRALRAPSLLPTLLMGSSSFHASSTTMLTPASAVTPRAFNRLALIRALQRYTSDVAYSTYANEPGAWFCCAAWLDSLILTVDVAALLCGSSSAMQIRVDTVMHVRPIRVCLSIAQSESRIHVRAGRPDHLRLLVIFCTKCEKSQWPDLHEECLSYLLTDLAPSCAPQSAEGAIEFKASP